MDGNKDEAVRCLAIAQKHRDAGNYPSARKFAQKSIALFETPEALKLLASINSAAASSSSGGPSTSTSSTTEEHPSASGARHRHPNGNGNTGANGGTAGGMGGEKREYTPEQHAMVKRVRTCRVTEYYEILSVSRTCEDVEVKKAYRKVCASNDLCLLSRH